MNVVSWICPTFTSMPAALVDVPASLVVGSGMFVMPSTLPALPLPSVVIEPKIFQAVRPFSASPHTQEALSLRNLENNWDDEGASPPAAEAVQRAVDAILWAEAQNLQIADVDADVLGGVAIWLAGVENRRAWISCMNSGCDTMALIEGDNYSKAVVFSQAARMLAVRFLTGAVDGKARD